MILNKLLNILMAFILSVSLTFGINQKPYETLVNNQNIIENNNILDTSVDVATIEFARKSVVMILVYDRLGNPGGIGSGIIFKRDNNYDYILTNQHVVAAGTVYEVVAYDMQKLAGVLIGSDGTQDIAVLRTTRFRDITLAPIGNSDNLSVGDTIFAIGNPGDINYRGSVSTGIVAGVNRNVSSRVDFLENQTHAIQVNLAINPGNSGGPIFTEDGLLMGVNTLKLTSDGSDTRYEGVNFALPINDMNLAAEKILNSALISNTGAVIQRGVYRRTSLGFAVFESLLDIDINTRKIKGIPNSIYQGVLVTNIEQSVSNPLFLSKLEPESIIVAIDNVPVTNKVELRKQVYTKNVGQSVTLTLLVKSNNGYQETKLVTTIIQAR